MQFFIAFALVLIPLAAQCETYRDIGPLDSLGDIKAKFPSATAKKLSPAWAQPTDAMYQFTGTGLSGTIIVKFEDGRPNYSKQLDANTDEASAKFLQRLANQSDEEALYVRWVRWVPDAPIPVQRLISKYGPPEKSAFSDEDFEPYRDWERKGVTAYLSSDEKNVVRIDFAFTKNEYRSAWQKKYQFVPDWLKEGATQPKTK